MTRRPDENPTSSEEPIEVHTGDVQPLSDSGEKPFDPESTLPMTAEARQRILAGEKPFDPERTQEGAPPEPPLPRENLFEGVQPVLSGERPVDITGPAPARRKGQDPNPAFLCVARGPGKGFSVAIPEGEHPIGRSSTCFLCIAHPSLSREHALFRREGNRFFVRDANSASGTRLNGVRIDAAAEVVPGDQIQLGDAVLILRHGPVVGPEMTDPGTMEATRAPAGTRPVLSGTLLGALVLTTVASATLASIVFTPLGTRLFKPAKPPETAVQPPAPAPPPVAPAPAPASDIAIEGDIEVKASVRDLPAPLPIPSPVAPIAPPGPEPVPGPAAAAADPPAATTNPSPTPAAKPAEPLPDPTVPLVAPLRPRPPAATTAPAINTTKASEALRLFNEGEVEAAITAAKESQSPIAGKLASFRKELDLAQQKLSLQDGLGAVRHLSAAANLDEQLTRGWSKPGGQVRAELTKLLVSLAEKSLTAGDAAQAAVLAEKALVYGPGNEKAERLLADAKAKKAAQP